MTIKPFTFDYWCFWQSKHDQFLLSNEKIKQLHYFKSLDDAINWLYFNGNKEAARSLNNHKKEGY